MPASEAQRAADKRWRNKNPGYKKAWRAKNLERVRASARAYMKTPEGRAGRRKFMASLKGRECRRRWRLGPAGQDFTYRHRRSPKGREAQRRSNERRHPDLQRP